MSPIMKVKKLAYVTTLTLAAKDLLFLVSKGEKMAAENQQKVISALEDDKLSGRITTNILNGLSYICILLRSWIAEVLYHS